MDTIKRTGEKYAIAVFLKDDNVWKEYTTLRNRVLQLIWTVKHNYFLELIDSNKL